jgi:hypothetical protein
MSDDRHKLQDKLFLHEFALIGSALASVHLTPDFFGMMEALGMAKDVSKFIHFKPGSSYGHADFRLEAYGILSDIPAEIEEISDDELKAHQHCSGLYVRIPIEEGQIVMGEVWGQRVFKKGIQAYIEEVWIPQNQKWLRGIMRTGDPNSSESIKQIQELSKGYSLLTHLHKQNVQGGDTRHREIQNIWADKEVLKNFAKKVDELIPLWTAIKEMADPCDSKEAEEEWLSGMLERPLIHGFMTQYPKLTKDLLRRAVDCSLKPVNREPRQLAFFHAAIEVEININRETLSIIDTYLKYRDKPLAPTSLKPYYDKGKALLN